MYPSASCFVAGPLGRAYLAELAGLDEMTRAFHVGGSHYAKRRSRPARRARVVTPPDDGDAVVQTLAKIAIDEALVSSLTTIEAIRRLGSMLVDFAFGSTTAWRRCMSLDLSWEPLLPIAELLASSPAVNWWGQPTDRTGQYWRPDKASGNEEDQSPAARAHALAAERAIPGIWWSEPVSQGVLSSCRSLPGQDVVPVTDLCHDDHRVRPPESPLSSASVLATARVYEVASEDDWRRLVTMYPSVIPANARPTWSDWTAWRASWVEPDWVRVAADWDGVHVTVAGYLAAAYHRLECDAGSTLLAGWDPDATVWLNPAVLLSLPDRRPDANGGPGP